MEEGDVKYEAGSSPRHSPSPISHICNSKLIIKPTVLGKMKRRRRRRESMENGAYGAERLGKTQKRVRLEIRSHGELLRGLHTKMFTLGMYGGHGLDLHTEDALLVVDPLEG